MQITSLAVAFAAISFTSALPSDTCSPNIVVTNSNNQTCTAECNTDHAGGDFAAQYTGSFSKCITACTNNAECQTAQFNRDNGYCYLKNTINSGANSTNTDSITCQQPAQQPPPPSTQPSNPTPQPQSCPQTKTFPSGRTCKSSCGKDRAGGDYAAQYVGSIQACVDACGADKNCVTAQYHEENGYCYLKNTSNALDESTTTDTIDCTDPPAFYIQASDVALKSGKTQDTNLYASNGKFAVMVEYNDGYGDKLITFSGNDTTSASAFYIDGLGRLISKQTGFDLLLSTGYRASKLYLSDPTQTFDGYSSPNCAVKNGVLTCSSGSMTGFSICFGGNNQDIGSQGKNGVAYLTTLPSTQGSQCRTLTANVVYA